MAIQKQAVTQDKLKDSVPKQQSALQTTNLSGGLTNLMSVIQSALDDPRSLTSANAVWIQRTIGNQGLHYVSDIVKPSVVQYKPASELAQSSLHSICENSSIHRQKGQNNPNQIKFRNSFDINRIQRSPLSEELKWLWDPNNKAPFFNRLRSISVTDPDVLAFVRTLSGDDRFLAENIASYGANENAWPIGQRVRLVMKSWYNGGGKGKVFDILRDANGIHADNQDLTNAINEVFPAGTEDLWYGQNLQIYGPEANWPSDVQENWRNARTARTQAPGLAPPAGSRHWPSNAIPQELLSGSQPLTPAEKAAIPNALTPVVSVGGVLPTFQPDHPVYGNYETRIRQRLQGWIAQQHADNVVGRGRAEHSDPTNLHPMSRFEQIGNIAKKEVDAVFGSYASGPAFHGGINLFDQWQTYDEEVWGTSGISGSPGLSDADKVARAENLVSYQISQDESIRDIINNQHGAVITRTTPPGPGLESEATILDRIRNHFASTETTRLLEIDRAWPATAGGGNVNIQLWKAATSDENRRVFWDAFQTMIHEYLHTLAHPNYENHANSFGDESPQYNTLIEGVDSFLTEIVWANVSGRVDSASLRQAVEGSTYAALPFNPNVIPSIVDQRYDSYAQAKDLLNIVGVRNLYAAYFLGRVDLIRGN